MPLLWKITTLRSKVILIKFNIFIYLIVGACTLFLSPKIKTFCWKTGWYVINYLSFYAGMMSFESLSKSIFTCNSGKERKYREHYSKEFGYSEQSNVEN